MNKILSKYNVDNCLLVISGYPKKGEIYSHGVCAVSSFTKNTILRLRKENPERKIVVLTIVLTGENEIYEEDGILIIRCFKRNSPLSYFVLLNQILKFNKPKDVLIEFEFASFGDSLTTSLMVPFVFALFLLRKNIILVIHQVLFDIRQLSGHIGVKSNSLKLKVLNLGLKCFYLLLSLPAKKIVVLEQEFKNRLSILANAQKIIVIPHGVDTDIRGVNRLNARKKFGIKDDEFVLLYFGYLTWYKGVDFLIDALKNVNYINGKRIRLVIAGGASFTQSKKAHYRRYLSMVSKLIKRDQTIINTGFVEEDKITPIFETSDLVILPYRTFMSSSGPLSLAISHKKPFILSSNLMALTNSNDIKGAMALLGIHKKDIMFKMNKSSLIKTISKSSEPMMQRKLTELSTILNKKRSFVNIAKAYEKVLWNESTEKAGIFGNFFSINKN